MNVEVSISVGKVVVGIPDGVVGLLESILGELVVCAKSTEDEVVSSSLSVELSEAPDDVVTSSSGKMDVAPTSGTGTVDVCSELDKVVVSISDGTVVLF